MKFGGRVRVLDLLCVNNLLGFGRKINSDKWTFQLSKYTTILVWIAAFFCFIVVG